MGVIIGKSKQGRIHPVSFVMGVLACVCMGVLIAALLRGQKFVTRRYFVNHGVNGKVRVAAISDLHGNAGELTRSQIINRIRREDPDIIVYLGDMVDREHAEEDVETLLLLTKGLAEIAPVYCVDGNHELDVKMNSTELYDRMIRELAELGAVHLDNEIVSVQIGMESGEGDNPTCLTSGSARQERTPKSEVLDKNVSAVGLVGKGDGNCGVNICGISTHYFWGDREYRLTEELRAMDGVNVLICHYPESVIWYDAFDGGGLDVALCGHTHGGLVRIPLIGGMYAPEQGKWPMYDLGAYPIYTDTTWRNYGGEVGAEYLGTLIISGGLAGEHGVPRINNPREVSIVDVGVVD